jgi:tyrosyl-tRNA synthetase
VVLQMGGSDQWGNIVSGVDLIRRTDATQVFGLTTPLITTASGNKMGKTASGAVWLTADKTSVFDYWQFWRNTDDGDVGRFLRLFTELGIPEITRLDVLGGAEINEAKKRLATEATALLHGRAAAEEAERAAEEIFFVKGEAAFPAVAGMVAVDRAEFEQGAPAFLVFVRAGLAASTGAARKLIRGGGARINDAAVADESRVITADELRAGVKLSAGRKQHRFVQAQ